jgi:hypothetical protein
MINTIHVLVQVAKIYLLKHKHNVQIHLNVSYVENGIVLNVSNLMLVMLTVKIGKINY